jgi:hypothetical protein
VARGWYEVMMRPSRRPASVTATIVLVTTCVVLTLVSWVLHASFSSHVHRRPDMPRADFRVSVGGWVRVLSVAEPGKLLIVGAAVGLWYGMRRPGSGARMAIAVLTAACAVTCAAAATYDGTWFVVLFFLATMESAANAMAGGSGLPEGATLGLGIASVVADVLLLGLAMACVALLSTRSWRQYLTS